MIFFTKRKQKKIELVARPERDNLRNPQSGAGVEEQVEVYVDRVSRGCFQCDVLPMSVPQSYQVTHH